VPSVFHQTTHRCNQIYATYGAKSHTQRHTTYAPQSKPLARQHHQVTVVMQNNSQCADDTTLCIAPGAELVSMFINGRQIARELALQKGRGILATDFNYTERRQ
jgi:hypothetical protein